MNKINKFLCGGMAALTFLSVGVGCVGGNGSSAGNSGGQGVISYVPVDYTYEKQSDHLVHFSSSDPSLDFFLNDYFKRHAGSIYEDGKDQKVSSVSAGVTAQQFFWQEWMSLAYYPITSTQDDSIDRIAGLRKLLSGVPVDRYGYVWQESDFVRSALSDLGSGEHRMGWPFPTSAHSGGMSRSWDFNGKDATNWSSNIGATLANGLFSASVEAAVDKVEFTSPVPANDTEEICAYYSPLLEIDVRMYTANADDIEDIYVWYTTAEEPNWSEDKKVSVNEKAFIAYDYTPIYEHMIFLPMYAEEKWNSDKDLTSYIRQIKVEIVPKAGRTLTGKFGLSYVRSTFDTRHVNNNSLLISSLRQDYDYTGDMDYLKANITRARKAMNFYMQMYDADRHLNNQSYLVGHDSDKTSSYDSDRDAMSLGNGYWDISFMPRYDFQSNMYFHQALVDLAYLENVLEANGESVDKSLATVMTADRQFNRGTSPYNYDAESLSSIANDVLTELRKPINETDKTGFWNEETGRFVAGYAHAEDRWYDYGYTMWNMEAIYYGIASDEQATSIMDWISGKRIVEKDKYGSQGEDIYYFEFAPRVNTYTVEDQDDLSMFTGFWADKKNVTYGEVQVQNGGAIMYTTFYDLMSRIQTYGADDAYNRLMAIKNWYKDVYDWYVESDNYNTHPDRFYWDYYCKGAWENPENKTYIPQNGIKGTQERNDGGGIVGIDGEFLESILPVAAVTYGFFGVESLDGKTIRVQPNLPQQLQYWCVENFAFNNVKYDLTIFDSAVIINSVRGDCAGLNVQVVLDAPKSGQKVYVNGKETSRYTLKDGKVYVTLPLEAVIVQVQ